MSGIEGGRAPTGPPAFGVTWGGLPQHATRIATVATAAAVVMGMAAPVAQATTEEPGAPVEVIVQEAPGAGNGPERAIAALGGTVQEPLGIIGGFTATVPQNRVDALRSVLGVRAVTENAAVTLSSKEVVDQNSQPGSLYTITREVIGAASLWNGGVTGKGVDVAVIDSGVVPVDGLRTPGKVVHGPDLSFEAQVCDAQACQDSPVRNLDTYGHGTHMAGIIAGRDDAAPAKMTGGDRENFTGVAPDARIVSVKVADAYGATDVSQVIAAIDWVVQNRKRNGLNIRVLNLSFGTDGVQSYQLDPLTYAAEQAWHKGIVVVAAAGNGGYGTAKLNNPAYDPYVIAVGASDNQATHGIGDDVIPAWSSTGDGGRNPDIVAPGSSVVGLRAPGSYLDNMYPAAHVGQRFFRGSGTSQAAAVVSGAAALLIQQRPELTPDQLKALLTGTAKRLPKADLIAQGKGLVDLHRAATAKSPHPAKAVQTWPRATGLGSLDAARGTSHLEYEGVRLEGEVDVTGRDWNPGLWAPAAAAETAWTGGSLDSSGWHGGAWLGQEWYATAVTGDPGESLEGLTWRGLTWRGLTWSGLTWRGLTWRGNSWEGLTWRGDSWTGLTWRGESWEGLTWRGLTWRGNSWDGLTWRGLTWSGKGWGG